MSWHEIRRRAGRFSQRWQGKEILGERSDTHTFYNEFFEIFGKDRSSVATYEKRVYVKDKEDNPQGMLWEDPEPVSTKDNGNKHPKYTDLLWPGVLLIEHKSPGENLHEAYEQAMERYAKNLPDHQRPRYIMISDFYNFRLYDETGGEPIKSFRLSELPQHVKEFIFMVNFNITPNLQGKQICDTDGAPMSGPILRAVRNNARWLLLVSWAVGLACGLGLSPVTDYPGEVSSPSHGSHQSNSDLLSGEEDLQDPIHLLAKGSVISPQRANLLVHVSLEFVNALIETGLAGPGLHPINGQECGDGSPGSGLSPFRKG